jgi:hypothetical protein
MNEETHYFGDLYDITFQESNHFLKNYIGGTYAYMGSISKETKIPSGLGRLINTTT